MDQFKNCLIYSVIIVMTSCLESGGQSLRTLEPHLGQSNTYSKQEEIVWSRTMDQFIRINSGDLSYDSLSAADKLMIDSLEMSGGPLTETAGCSWYCGGGPYKITSSDYLKDQGKINYRPENLHDFDLLTAWVPDTKGRVTDKKINFHFKPFAPRVNRIIIYNGYIKNTDLWKANARAKTLKLFINQKPYAHLHLEDVTDIQEFVIEPVQSVDSTKDLVLTFEILEVYKGSSSDDLAISEINFDGLDVHCFAAGSKVTMTDGSQKNIESIAKGDKVLSYQPDADQLQDAVVSRLVTSLHSNLVTFKFEDRAITATDDHPFYTEDGWASLSPDKSNGNYLQDNPVGQLQIGDKLRAPGENKILTLINFVRVRGEALTYTIELENGDSFIVNGLVVKTEVH